MRSLVLGRFQPPHRGHLATIRDAARGADAVLVGVGSTQRSHEPDNPLTVGERFDLLRLALADAGLVRVHLFPVPDLELHHAWVAHVERLLPPFDVVVTNNPLTRRLFRTAGYRVRPAPLWRPGECSGTAVRARWRAGNEAASLLPPAVLSAARRWGLLERVRGRSKEE